MPICVLKRGDLCDRMSSHENEARFLYQNEGNLRDRETKLPPTSILFHMHLHRQPNANAKLGFEKLFQMWTETFQWVRGTDKIPIKLLISIGFCSKSTGAFYLSTLNSTIHN